MGIHHRGMVLRPVSKYILQHVSSVCVDGTPGLPLHSLPGLYSFCKCVDYLMVTLSQAWVNSGTVRRL